MSQEIERKFAVKKMPDLAGIKPVLYERYFLKINEDFEDRIQKKEDKFEREIKERKSDLTRETKKTIISEEEFLSLKEKASKSIIRESYLISEEPQISIKIYHDDHEGLVRAEVEFQSEKEAQKFVPLSWMGKEITDLPIGKDAKLIQLSKSEFLSWINEIK